jgi:Helix-turn-helix domain
MAMLSLGDVLARNADLQPKPQYKIRSARSRNRAAAWRYDLEQWRQYRLTMVESDSERAAIEADYRERSAAGPDFAAYHAKSDFSEPHLHDLDRCGKQAILTAFDQVRAWLWRNCRKPHGQAVSRVYREVLSALLAFAVKHGKVYPSQATIAAMACCSERTVARALAWLRLWGFLSWQRRLKRIPGRLGSVVRQTSNAYCIALQGLAALGAAVFSQRSGRHNSSPSPLHRIRSQLLVQEKSGAA